MQAIIGLFVLFLLWYFFLGYQHRHPFFTVTGTITITSIHTFNPGAKVRLIFLEGSLLKHNDTKLILPDGKDIQTKPGDEFFFLEYEPNKWKKVFNHV